MVVLRRCPALPLAGAGSTVGAERLSFRVRDGSGRFPFAVAAATSVVLWCRVGCLRAVEWMLGRVSFVVVCGVGCVVGLLVPVGFAPRWSAFPRLAYRPGVLPGAFTPSSRSGLDPWSWSGLPA